jgi:hypothetical protein
MSGLMASLRIGSVDTRLKHADISLLQTQREPP